MHRKLDYGPKTGGGRSATMMGLAVDDDIARYCDYDCAVPMKFLIIDDHPMVREGVATMLRAAYADATVLHAADGATGLAIAAAHPDLDLVLLDLAMPHTGGMATLEAFGAQCPGVPVVVLSGSEDIRDVRHALALGALGYVAKSANPTTLVAALKLMLDGEIYVPTFVIAHHTDGQPNPSTGLTARQAEVLVLIGDGLANKQIAARLGLSEKTVKAHVTAILRSLDVSTRAEAARTIITA